jgi:hypothetical protein
MTTIAETRATTSGLDRHAPLSGVLAVICWIVATALLDAVESKDTAAEMLAAFEDQEGRILFGGILFLIGTALFIWFLGSLRLRLIAAEGANGRLTPVAFAGGIATATCLALLPGPVMAGAISHEDLDASAAAALGAVGDTFFFGAEYLLTVLLVASALVALRYGALPRWLAWVQLLLALVLLSGVIGWAGLIFVFPVWVVVVSFLLWRDQPRIA